MNNPRSAESYPDVSTGRLARWLLSWVQKHGAIHGFHNHSVWGNNPYRLGDWSCGHSTFASLLLPALACALRKNPDLRGQEVLINLWQFQCDSKQEDGQFRHIGFELGELVQRGLIHNMVPCVSLCLAARANPDLIPQDLLALADQSIRGTLAACERHFGLCVNEGTTSNQAYCRVWALLEHMEVFAHDTWDDAVRELLQALEEQFHVPDLPHQGCIASLRESTSPGVFEPAEYYGLMIHPLLSAWQRYGDPHYLEVAKGFARHVIESAWRDGNGCLRLHRLWRTVENEPVLIREPMLIGGMGITLSGIQRLQQLQPDPALESFLGGMDHTYSFYQNPAGFFLAASGWNGEQDVIPSSAWQSHDLFHLIQRHGVSDNFWELAFADYSRVAVVLGTNLLWAETATHWTVRGYETCHGLELAGRKDCPTFGVDIPRWIPRAKHLEPDQLLPDRPNFLKTDNFIVLTSGRKDLDVLNASAKEWRPPSACG